MEQQGLVGCSVGQPAFNLLDDQIFDLGGQLARAPRAFCFGKPGKTALIPPSYPGVKRVPADLHFPAGFGNRLPLHPAEDRLQPPIDHGILDPFHRRLNLDHATMRLRGFNDFHDP